MYQALTVIAALCLAACAAPSTPAVADMARGICAENGHPLGSAGFDRCFNETFSALNMRYLNR